MRDMFYNYDHYIENKEHLKQPIPSDTDQLINNTNVRKLLNAKGDEIGIRAKQNSTFYLYFKFLSDTELDFYETFENNLYFDVVDFKHEKIASFPVKLADFVNEACVKIVTSEDGPLKYGVYRMHLYAIIDEQKYTLFSEEDGILSIE